MSLNKQDLKSIREVFRDEFPSLFEKAMIPFATAIQEDINKVLKKISNLNKRLIKVEDDVSYLRGRTDLIENKIEKLRKELKEELRKKPNKSKVDKIEKQVLDLETRVSKLESN